MGICCYDYFCRYIVLVIVFSQIGYDKFEGVSECVVVFEDGEQVNGVEIVEDLDDFYGDLVCEEWFVEDVVGVVYGEWLEDEESYCYYYCCLFGDVVCMCQFCLFSLECCFIWYRDVVLVFNVFVCWCGVVIVSLVNC